jgi:hypothetical protein
MFPPSPTRAGTSFRSVQRKTIHDHREPTDAGSAWTAPRRVSGVVLILSLAFAGTTTAAVVLGVL